MRRTRRAQAAQLWRWAVAAVVIWAAGVVVLAIVQAGRGGG